MATRALFPLGPLYRRHLQGTGHEHLVADSFYVHAFRNAPKASLNDLGYKIRENKGAELELIGGDALRQLELALSPAFKAAVLIKGQARAVSPGRIGTALAQKALDQGAEVLRTDVSGLTRQADGTWGLATSNGAVQTKKLCDCSRGLECRFAETFGFGCSACGRAGIHR